MGNIIHFEVTTPDVAGTAEFFASSFGWDLTASPFLPGYLLAATGPGAGIDGAIMSRDHQSQPVIAWLEVADIASSLKAVIRNGGSVVNEVQELPGEGLVAYVTDPTGTLWGVKQPSR
ncbi:VOC family protein [Nonomuraea jiangxiensis]|uniref:VOC domain-containing protein n=1 Tax=Nonomuraea jiangxiensis TaxID=633440 RepID=A0A1G9A1R5_9ACTN|nr:VOC family protein [Nonomuraea jiangxiensis]SDK21211.1 hypothetical protein SAMN05421869_114247 [Nonomuraea jiangxiensis]